MLQRMMAVMVALMAVVFLPSGAMAQALPAQDLIHCLGTESGGGGLRLYHYDIFNGEPVALTDVYVAADDLNANNYGNWMEPQGWTHALQGGGGGWRNFCVKTPHGQFAPMPVDTTAGWIHWNVGAGLPIGLGAIASFGFDNDQGSQNVDWYTAPPGNVPPGANWNSRVGTGQWGVWTDGPVHSPIPEPASLALLALGALVLLRRR